MSGSIVQRGECAIFDKWQRAKMAVEAGADLVVELPTYYVLQSADVFACGAVGILDAMKVVDGLSFGSECGDIEIIKKAAEIMSDENSAYNELLRQDIKAGIGYPKASHNALCKCMPEYGEMLSKPNNTLGISYVKALTAINSNIKPLCIKRDNDYHGVQSDDGYMSASAIRNMINSAMDYSKYCEDYTAENVHSLKNAESFILGYLRNISAENLGKIKGSEDGLANLVKKSASNACTIDELFEMCVSKRYTLHRIKRYVMAAILGIDYDANPEYIRVLAIGKNGARLLKDIKAKSGLDIITKVADYKENSKMFETDIKATDFQALCSGSVKDRYSGKDFKISPYVKTNK